MAADNSTADGNHQHTLIVMPNDSTRGTVNLWADPTTHRLLVDAGSIGFDIGKYDYVARTLAGDNVTETWTFKSGGSGGTLVNTVVIVYTDTTRSTISTVTKT